MPEGLDDRCRARGDCTVSFRNYWTGVFLTAKGKGVGV